MFFLIANIFCKCYTYNVMKCITIWILSFLILFSTVDLSLINLFKILYNIDNQKSAISEVIKVQYELFLQTKVIVGNVCKSIVKDVQILLSAREREPIFFDAVHSAAGFYGDNFFNFVRVTFLSTISKYGLISKILQTNLFFFGFIFIFLLKYLGLLFTFGKKIILHHDIKAYGI